MKVSSKMFILWIGIIAALAALLSSNIPGSIISAGAFISFAILESRELKILNTQDKEE